MPTAEATLREKAGPEATPGSAKKNNKYLTFKLGDEEYGLEILKVREIIGLMEITRIPRTPDYVCGVINLRGKVVPVIDTRIKFNMDTVEITSKSCIIVVEVKVDKEPLEMGILVDSVSEVLDIMEEDIEDTPEFGTGVDTKFILGIAKSKGGVKILLNIDKVLSEYEIKAVSNTQKTNHAEIKTNTNQKKEKNHGKQKQNQN